MLPPMKSSDGTGRLSPIELPKRCNSCALTYSVNRGLMRTASGHAMCAPLSPNVYHQWECPQWETQTQAPQSTDMEEGEMWETPQLKVNGVHHRTSSTSSGELAALAAQRARLSRQNSWGGKKSASSSMLTIPEGAATADKRRSLNVNTMGSWAEMCASPVHNYEQIDSMSPEERKSAIDTALATILTIPECRESLRRSIAAKMNWAEWAVSPYGGAASPISPFDFYQAAGLERARESIFRPPPGLSSDEDASNASTEPMRMPHTPHTPPTPIPLWGGAQDDYAEDSGIGRSAAVRRNPWAVQHAEREVSSAVSPETSAKGSLKGKSIDAPTINMTRVKSKPEKSNKSIWDRAIDDHKEKKVRTSNVKIVELRPSVDEGAAKLVKKVRQPRGKGRSKYTCHIFVPEVIAKDKPFRAPSYIIGNGGSNMKAIHERTGTKLRVRGQGSGFKERGAYEADAPLHLCISADTTEQLEKTKALIFPLFERMIDMYCDRRNVSKDEFEITMTMS